MSALWIFLIHSLLQKRSLVCSCPCDRHARRLPLRDDPKSHFKEDCTVLFHKNKTVEIFFLVDFFSVKRLFVAYFASKCKLFDKDKSDFYHKDLLRVYQKQNLALSLSLSLSWFKPDSALIWKYECWCEFEKDLEVFQYSFSETIPIFFIRLSVNIVNVLHSKVATKFKLKCTGHGGMDDPH